MKQASSTIPYLIRAFWEWCHDNRLEPCIAVRVDGTACVPLEYVQNGEIVLNISSAATRGLRLGNELIQFSGRFNGRSREVSVSVAAVTGIYAKESGRGFAFPAPGSELPAPLASQHGAESDQDGKPHSVGKAHPGGRPNLHVVK